MKQIIAITESLASKGISGMLISHIRNIRYLSGFTGSSACLLITKKERIFFTDSRYEEQSKREVRGFDIVIESEERPKQILERAKAVGIKTLGFESTVSYAFYKSLLRKGFRVKSVTNLVEELRRIKSRLELKMISRAVERAEKAFLEVKPYIKPGFSERHLALRLEAGLKSQGCAVIPFDIIVAAGKNSAMPHARPTDNRIKQGDFIMFDWAGEAGGYFSDMTRTFLLRGGKDLSRKIEVYNTVLSANQRAITSVGEGVIARTVDKTARDVIKKAGYGDFFGHGTGHGVGLDVHELPRVSRFGRETIRAGMVFTIEPGIYLPGFGGVRIEDMVHVEKHGCTTLTTLPKRLETV
ncbi:MAG: aminopeptidase P family protein [Nitrospirae bacterium]|nr:aminopeptidase P family protein [Nitrospirota bacterium]